MKFLTKIIVMVLFLGVTLFSKDIATVTGVNGKAYVERDGAKIELRLGLKLQEKDSIITSDDSKVQIIFEDESIVSIGKNSSFSIDEYLFEENQEPVARFAMLKGAMRTITGKIGKIAPEKFSVKTKTATIGIRGTNFTIIIGEDGSQNIFCTFGAISVRVNGVEHKVAQGFYVHITASGKVEIKEFTAEQLQQMKKDHFAKNKRKRGKAKKDIFLDDDEQLDTTRDDENDVVVKDITEDTQDAQQTQDDEERTPTDATTPTDDTSPTPTNDTQPTQPTTRQVVMGGYDVNSEAGYYKDLVSLDFVDDGSLFTSANSWVQDSSYGEMGGTANWKFTMSTTPTSYVSAEEFSIEFSAVEVTGGEYTNARLTTGAQPNVFIATGDDLVDGDYMSWGTWSATVLYDDTYNSQNDEIRTVNGLWVAGEPTDISVVNGLSGSAVSYDGVYRAIDVNSASMIADGAANITVDFGADTADLTLYNVDGGGTYLFDMIIFDNRLESLSVNADDGQADGTFYGPDGSAIGGNFRILDGSTEYKGVYEVDK